MSGDLVCLSHLRWGFVYQRPNHLMSRCARQRRVFFVEDPVFDAEVPRVDVQEVERNLHVVVPHLRGGTRPDAAEREQESLLHSLLGRAGVRQPVLWFYTPMALGYAHRLQSSAVIYDCMDELSHFHGAPAALREREIELFRRADLVFTGGQSLYEAKRAHHPRVTACPSSVDATHFEQARRIQPDPEDQRPIPHPRLGFFGVIDERMDLDLLRTFAELRPSYQIVLIGPVVKIDPATLPRAANLHYLGPKRYEELPAYIAGWDVAIMPFARNDATRFISPTKTLEYLAAGKPVVSTSIRDVVRPYGDEGLARIADDPLEFAEAVDEVIREKGTRGHRDRRTACDAKVAQTSWDRTWARMHGLIEDVLAQRRRRGETQEEAAPCSTI
jgi:glycosyltransferase involved in cell wall biosynthesis